MTHWFYPDLASTVETPTEGTLSRVVHRDDRLRIVLFAFDRDQELTEHTAAVPAVLQVLGGELDVTVDGENMTMQEGGVLVLAAHAPHSVVARRPSVLLLTMVKAPD